MTSEAAEDSFKASHGWFNNFKRRTGVHSILRHGEAASSDVKGAEEYVKKFSLFIAKEGYLAQQVFYCDEIRLLEKMPQRTFITAEEKKQPAKAKAHE